MFRDYHFDMIAFLCSVH